jgi:diaminopimelate epimerase
MAKKPYTGVNGNGNEYLVTDNIEWNYGFEKMLMLRLAVELCQSYEIQPSQILVSKMQEAEANVKTHNYQPSTLKTSSRWGRRTKSRGLYR